jgi:hypothetical protein
LIVINRNAQRRDAARLPRQKLDASARPRPPSIFQRGGNFAAYEQNGALRGHEDCADRGALAGYDLQFYRRCRGIQGAIDSLDIEAQATKRRLLLKREYPAYLEPKPIPADRP